MSTSADSMAGENGQGQDRAVVARARSQAETAAVDAGREDLTPDLSLVVSELVTNALLHGGGCRSVTFSPVADGVRVEVRDNNRIPPVVGRPGEGSLTGRGIQLVSSLAERWGADTEGPGKVVWAEVTGTVKPAGEELSGDDLLAMWEDALDEAGPRQRVELGVVPTDLLLAAKSHVDNLMREFTLASGGAESGQTADVPAHLSALLRTVVDQFADARLAIKHHALEAARHGHTTTNLVLDLPLDAADRAEDYVAALDEVDAYCRAKRLLTLETPPQHRLFRHWYIEELVAQLRAAAAGRPAPPRRTFEDRLLGELDRLADAERSSARAARLYAVASALATAASPAAVAQVVLTEAVAALRASGGGILLATDHDTLTVPGAVGYGEELVARLRNESRDAELPAAVALRTQQPVWLESREERDARFPELAGLEASTVSMCAVPLQVGGRALGALRFSFSEARLFDEDERRFILALAAQAAQAMDRARLQDARIEVSRRLQRSLLPPSLPDIPGLDLAAFYHPFGDGIDVGGDFYDVWQLDDDTWAVAIGDASGTGPEAASLTALARHTLRAVSFMERNPVRVIDLLNRALLQAASSEWEQPFCTALFATVARAGPNVRLRIANGGHPYPVLRRAWGEVHEFPVPGTLLGLFPDPEIGRADLLLRPGGTAVFVTDGVIEARRDNVMFGVEGVTTVLGHEVRSAEALSEELEAAVLGHTGAVVTDDMAAVVLRVQPDVPLLSSP